MVLFSLPTLRRPCEKSVDTNATFGQTSQTLPFTAAACGMGRREAEDGWQPERSASQESGGQPQCQINFAAVAAQDPPKSGCAGRSVVAAEL